MLACGINYHFEKEYNNFNVDFAVAVFIFVRGASVRWAIFKPVCILLCVKANNVNITHMIQHERAVCNKGIQIEIIKIMILHIKYIYMGLLCEYAFQ